MTSTLTVGMGPCTCSCSVGAAPDQPPAVRVAVAAGSPSGGGLQVKVGGAYRDHFSTFRLRLSAYAGGGCKPYYFTWTRGKIPKPKVLGVAVNAQPAGAGPIRAQASSALQITMTCRLPRRQRRSLPDCGFPLTYRVDVRDSSVPKPKTGQAEIGLRWLPACLSAQARKELKQKRSEIERELWTELRNTVGGAFSLEKVIEYLEAPELAPALFLKDAAEVGAAGVKAFEEAGRIDDQLSEPNC